MLRTTRVDLSLREWRVGDRESPVEDPASHGIIEGDSPSLTVPRLGRLEFRPQEQLMSEPECASPSAYSLVGAGQVLIHALLDERHPETPCESRFS